MLEVDQECPAIGIITSDDEVVLLNVAMLDAQTMQPPQDRFADGGVGVVRRSSLKLFQKEANASVALHEMPEELWSNTVTFDSVVDHGLLPDELVLVTVALCWSEVHELDDDGPPRERGALHFVNVVLVLVDGCEGAPVEPYVSPDARATDGLRGSSFQGVLVGTLVELLVQGEVPVTSPALRGEVAGQMGYQRGMVMQEMRDIRPRGDGEVFNSPFIDQDAEET